MAKLFFKNSDLLPLVETLKTSTKFRIPYSGNKSTKSPSLWLVKDSGVYLMPSAILENYDSKVHVVYAEGFNPNEKGFSYAKTAHAVGGDDFVETVPMPKSVQKNIEEGASMVINLTKENMEISLVKPKK